MADICAVLVPLRCGTMKMQRTKALAGMYLPVWSSVMHQLSPEVQEMRRQPGAGTFSANEYVDVTALNPLAQRLRNWLHLDLGRMKEKHVTSGNGDAYALLQVASYLDPRFKFTSRYMPDVPCEEMRERVSVAAVRRSETLAKGTPARRTEPPTDARIREQEELDPVLATLNPSARKRKRVSKLPASAAAPPLPKLCQEPSVVGSCRLSHRRKQ